MSEGLTDTDIVLGLRNGDRHAWDALCQQYSVRLWRYVARLIGSDQDAVADVYQETMLAVARAGRNLDAERTTLWAWLAGIAHNQTALYWRGRYRDRHASDSEETADSRIDSDPTSALSRAELVDDVRCILSEMNSEHVALLIAKYLDDRSVAELVAANGGTTEAVRSKLARARREFRERYGRLNGKSSPADKSLRKTENSLPIVEETSADER